MYSLKSKFTAQCRTTYFVGGQFTLESSVNIKHVNTNYVAVSSGFIMYRLNDDSKFPQRSISAVFKCFSHPGLPGRTASVCCCRDAILIRARGFVVYGEFI